MPRCNIAAMNLHLAEISAAVTPGAHAILVLDQAGWHMSDQVVVPANIILLPLPPKCPELNPVETMGVHTGQLALKSDLRLVQEYRRSLLPCLEQARRPTLDHHDYRSSGLGV